MQILDAKALTKSYGPRLLLDGVSVTLQAGERVGLVGVNGSGKTTLGRILAGVEQADGGEVARRRDATVTYLPQTPSLAPELTPRQHALAGLTAWSAAMRRHEEASARVARSGGEANPVLDALAAAAADVERAGGWELGHRAEALLGQLRITDLDRPVGEMSGGEQRRVALAQALVGCPALVVLDEPTNHLDVTSVEWLEHHLAAVHQGAILVITHDRYLLDRVVTRTLELDQGQLFSYEGGYAAFLAGKARRLDHEVRAEANRQRFVRQELEWLRRAPKARTGKQHARIKRAEEALSVSGPADRSSVQLDLQASRSSRAVLELSDLRIEVAGRPLVQDLTFTITRGQRVGIIGPSGCGKTTLLRTITGEVAPTAGSLRLAKTAQVSYLRQTRDDLDERETVVRNIAGDHSHVTVGGRQVEVHGYLARFLFRATDHDRPVSALSGGERTRVALARMMLQPANLILMDEPTNDLDVATLSSLESLLLEFGGTALVVTHDRWFLDRVATWILAFEGDGQVVAYAGDYSTYRALRTQAELAERDASAAESAAAAPRARRQEPQRRPRGLTYGESIELEALEGRIEAAEARVSELEALQADPATYQRQSVDVTALARELEQARAEAEGLMTRWEELETKREAGA